MHHIIHTLLLSVVLQDDNDTKRTTEEYDSTTNTKNSSVKMKDNVIATTWKDGPYLLVVKIESSRPLDAAWNLTSEVL